MNIPQCRVRIERRQYRGMDAPKSRPDATDGDPVFLSPKGARLNYANVYNRMLKPALRAAGIEDGAFHRLRHTCGTVLRRRGASLEQIQLHLGHHDMSFTRRVYVHLDTEDGPDPTVLDDLTGCAPAPRRLKLAAGG